MTLMGDFEKVFDSVSFDFIGDTLEIFGFGPVHKNWINILFDKLTGAVLAE